MPSPGQLLAKVEPYGARIRRSIQMLEDAFSGAPIDKEPAQTPEEKRQWRMLKEKGRLLQKEMAQIEAQKATPAPVKDWSEAEITKRRDRMKAQMRSEES